MRVLVCGGRDYHDADRVFAELDLLHDAVSISCVIDGKARGADTLGHFWAKARAIDYARFPALWTVHGRKRAGPIRNKQMLVEGKPDLVVAFPGGTGTADMVQQARAAGVPVLVI